MKTLHPLLTGLVSIFIFSIATFGQTEKFVQTAPEISIKNFESSTKIDSSDLDSIIIATMNEFYLPGVATAVFTPSATSRRQSSRLSSQLDGPSSIPGRTWPRRRDWRLGKVCSP